MENIFYQSGSAKNVFELQGIFDMPDRYGKGLDWSQYLVHDAASLVLRYLKTLPEPVIPFDCYSLFIACLSRDAATKDTMTSIAEFQDCVINLSPLNRQLLLYLLDLLAVFASKSQINHMTSSRLVAVFPDRNLDTSQLTAPRDPAPPLLRRLRPGSTSAQVCSGLLRSAYPSHQKSSTFNEPERAPFPSQRSQICFHYN